MLEMVESNQPTSGDRGASPIQSAGNRKSSVLVRRQEPSRGNKLKRSTKCGVMWCPTITSVKYGPTEERQSKVKY